MVNGKDPVIRHKAAVVVFHMKIIKTEHNARTYIVCGHGSVAGIVAELPHGAAIALRKQDRSFLLKGFGGFHGRTLSV